ncbi:hypothetical protein FisN_15Hu348 [Fistulifera solaris]|uniref:Uncharacterized protein n=1 Tax=Fistulifera solaris TaxID=1519565 RepID=A0A1Z5JFT6_FISSO|nr:hypothetical protein FisN_15Hu348 [Fistulifera solaris]|eukprot:GAX12863.1 hypothetical protein FisN_15Hu348 [Fistulifera solaris]
MDINCHHIVLLVILLQAMHSSSHVVGMDLDIMDRQEDQGNYTNQSMDVDVSVDEATQQPKEGDKSESDDELSTFEDESPHNDKLQCSGDNNDSEMEEEELPMLNASTGLVLFPSESPAEILANINNIKNAFME